jgi:chemotaxis protein methyltransferase CheR
MPSSAAVSPESSPLANISDQDFAQFQRFIYEAAGITIAAGKKVLVTSRLGRRLQQCECASYGEYLRLLASGQRPEEMQIAVDLLTTNETYFFREPRHFDFLREQVKRASRASPMRIWSAAGSTGEEAYSIAMVLEDSMQGHAWEVVASDISTRVITKARAGHYPMDRARGIPLPYLQRFCLKGEGKQEQTLLVSKQLRSKVRFQQVNLNAPLPNLGTFDIIFLRNVLIYFNTETKREVMARVISQLKPGGWLFIGHSENLRDITDEVTLFAPSIFQKR